MVAGGGKMVLMRRFWRRRQEERSLDGFGDLLRRAGYLRATYTGRPVTVESALTGTVAVYACVSLLADTMGSLPLMLYRDGESRERVEPGPTGKLERLARMLHQQPNPEMTASELWSLVESHLDTWGNAVLNVVRGPDGWASELWPLRPDAIEFRRDPEKHWIYSLPTGEKRKLDARDVCHIRTGVSLDGVWGVSPIGVVRQAVAIEQAATEYIGRYFRDAAIPGGILRSPTKLSAEERQALRDEFGALHRGLDNAHRVAVLSNLEWQQVSLPPKDAEFVALRKFSIAEVARLFRVPPHMVGDVERSTSWGTGIEHQSINYVVHTIRPRCERIEQALSRDLGPEGMTLRDDGLIVEFNVDHLLRGDAKARAEAYAIAVQNGWMTRNEVRRRENLPPIDGLDTPLLMPGQQEANARAANEVLLAEAIRALHRPPTVKVQVPPPERVDGRGKMGR